MGFIPQPHLKVNPDDPWRKALSFVAALGTLPHLFLSSPIQTPSLQPVLPDSLQLLKHKKFPPERCWCSLRTQGPPRCPSLPHRPLPALQPNLAISTPCSIPHILPPVPTYFREKKKKKSIQTQAQGVDYSAAWGKQLLVRHPPSFEDLCRYLQHEQIPWD